MGRVFLENCGGIVSYHCYQCSAYLTNRAKLISDSFQGATGTAYLFSDVVNITLSKMEMRAMITGKHLVRDVSCKNCGVKLGWMYEFAYEKQQTYKEGHVILEQKLLSLNNEGKNLGVPRSRCASTSSMDSSNVSSVTIT